MIFFSCPVPPVRLLSSPLSQDVKFSFKAFDFRHFSSGFVYIHCEVTVCSRSDSNCMMGCSRRTRRAASVSQYGGSHLLSTGPFVMAREDIKDGKLPLCILGNFSCFFLLSADFFFQNHFFLKLFQECHQSEKQFGSRSGPTFCWA